MNENKFNLIFSMISAAKIINWQKYNKNKKKDSTLKAKTNFFIILFLKSGSKSMKMNK